MMKKTVAATAGILTLMFVVLGAGAVNAARPGAQAPAAQTGARAERTTWYFYRVKWGFQDEFVALFAKNHLPVLR